MKFSSNERYHTIDSLREVAALAVVFFHLYGALKEDLIEWVPSVLDAILSYGFVGVPIFFVLSGFVISLSVGEARVSSKYAINFAFRRSLRLDPPYWVAIALALTLMFIKANYIDKTTELPSLTNILSHIFYLQDILGSEPKISVVYWTLCLEIQFYLVFIFSVYLCQVIAKNQNYEEYIKFIIILLMGFLSLCIDHKIIDLKLTGLFLQYWHYFLIGVLAQIALKKDMKHKVIFVLWLVLEVLFLINFEFKNYIIAAVLTSTFIFIGGVRHKLGSYLNNVTLQFFGKISYSLYLLHADIGWKTISIGKKILGADLSVLEAVLLFVAGLSVSIIGAVFLYHFVEKPFVKFSQKFKLAKIESKETLNVSLKTS